MVTAAAGAGSLSQPPLARGFARRRQLLRCRRLRRGRRSLESLGHRCGEPNEVGVPLVIFGTAGVRLDTIKQCPGLVGAELRLGGVYSLRC